VASTAYFKPRVKEAALKVSAHWESFSDFLLACALSHKKLSLFKILVFSIVSRSCSYLSKHLVCLSLVAGFNIIMQ